MKPEMESERRWSPLVLTFSTPDWIKKLWRFLFFLMEKSIDCSVESDCFSYFNSGDMVHCPLSASTPLLPAACCSEVKRSWCCYIKLRSKRARPRCKTKLLPGRETFQTVFHFARRRSSPLAPAWKPNPLNLYTWVYFELSEIRASVIQILVLSQHSAEASQCLGTALGLLKVPSLAVLLPILL